MSGQQTSKELVAELTEVADWLKNRARETSGELNPHFLAAARTIYRGAEELKGLQVLNKALDESAELWKARALAASALEPLPALADVLWKWHEYAKGRRDGERLPLHSSDWQVVDDMLQEIRRAAQPPGRDPICVMCAQPLSVHTPAQFPAEMFNPHGYVLKCPPLTKGESAE